MGHIGAVNRAKRAQRVANHNLSIETPAMFVWTMKVGEVIRISDNVYVKILDIRGSRIQLGIEAPQNVAITPNPQPSTFDLAERLRQRQERSRERELVPAKVG